MSETEQSPAPSPDDRFAARIQAEVVEAAERRRRENVDVARVEREIERVWADVAPPGAVGPTEELLLDRVDRLSLIDVDAPIGERPGIKQVKGAIRKGTYWYLRYMSDQLNALHNVHARLLRRMDERLDALEAAAGLDDRVDELVGTATPPGAGVGRTVADAVSVADGPVLVASCGAGTCVEALQGAGARAFGVDADPRVVLEGIDRGLDLRVGDAPTEIAALEAGSLGAVVLGGDVLRRPLASLSTLFSSACAAVGSGGVVVLAPERIAERTPAEAELLAGRGLSAEAWAQVATSAGEVARLEHDDPGLDAVVVVRLP